MAKPRQPEAHPADGRWLDAGGGYRLTLEGGALVAQNAAGKRLASVPKDVRASGVGEQLEALGEWLDEHARECATAVEQWMLRSREVPRAVLQAVWDDPAWRAPLENAVISAGGTTGLFRGVDTTKGVGVVDLDGETAWIAADGIAIPHPILIDELDAWRELVTQLGVTQGVAQLHRETHAKPAGASGTSIEELSEGKFAMLLHALNKARALGYKVKGGFATTRVWDAGAVSEARFWIGSDSPEQPAATGQLIWVDARERVRPIAEVGAVAFSEGMRMASAIYAARVVEAEQ